ncbi:Zinc finger protein [Plakobranchus ocellatus]|uniref:Zinc finger protein n=1 Tax=Plakobranchus ocellatus TaxID=259542 RepID=A0AAV3Z3T7_9GAST|nr:Zinc finger protein [Plakobranchus ocellatus]
MLVKGIDDLLVKELFKRLQRENFTVRLTKCVLGTRTIDFLCHRLGEGTIGRQEENVEKVRAAPRPKTKKEFRAILGLSVSEEWELCIREGVRSYPSGSDQELQKGKVPGYFLNVGIQGATSLLAPHEADEFLQFESDNMASPDTKIAHT